MGRKSLLIAACVDSNIFVSGIAFGGKPLRVLERALRRDFRMITSVVIMNEVRRNLVGKLGLSSRRVDDFLTDILAVSSAYVPTGEVTFISHPGDDLVLEVSLMSGADVLVTGDRRHLLPLNPFKGLTIEPPSAFLRRLDGL